MQLQGADYMSLTEIPDVYVKFIADLKIRAAAAMKVYMAVCISVKSVN